MNLVTVESVTLKMEVACSSETFDQTHYTTRHEKEDYHLNNTRDEILQTYVYRAFNLSNTARCAHALSH
jgi:hypothetical protein